MPDKEAMWQECRKMEEIGKLNDAFKTALRLREMDPKDPEINETLRRLKEKSDKIAEADSSVNRLKKMIQYITDKSMDEDKRLTAAKNLFTLFSDDSGIRMFKELKVLDTLKGILKDSNDFPKLQLTLIRILAKVVGPSFEIAEMVFSQIGINYLIELMIEQKDDEILPAIQSLIHLIVKHFSSFDHKKNREKAKIYDKKIETILIALVERINQRMMSAECRDHLLTTTVICMPPNTIEWGMILIKKVGLSQLLEVASELIELRYESSIPITATTRSQVSAVLESAYSTLECDQSRNEFHQEIMNFIDPLVKVPDIESNIRAIAAITALLSGPIDAGNFCLTQAGVIEKILVLGQSGDYMHQSVAIEAIIAMTSKKDKCKSIAPKATEILNSLLKSEHPKIKVRALLALSKVGSVGGSDSTVRVLSKDSTFELYTACCNLLLGGDGKENEDKRNWATESLAYLTVNAEIKESLIKDIDVLKKLIQFSTNGDLTDLSVIAIFVNLTNSYEKKEAIPELKELAKFAKQHVPEEHEFDGKEYVDNRCKVLAENTLTGALVTLAKTQSKTCREMISRAFNAICEHSNLCGYVVREGGVRVLINLSTENTNPGKLFAAQALARIAITNNPDLVFPGQRSVEVIGPIMLLLHQDCSGLQNFESLMALTNLAQVSVQCRNRILKDGGFSHVEQYIYEDHEMLKRASVECIANLILSDQVVKLFEAENDRVKYFVILCGDDDFNTVKAASGGLAMLTSISRISCQKILNAKDWKQILIQLVCSQSSDLMHRGVTIVHNMISANGECGKAVIESEILELLMAIIRPEVTDINDTIKTIAQASLNRAEQLKLVTSVKRQVAQSENDEDEREM